MGTIIAHGKGQWNQANKNKRVDDELEAELLVQKNKSPNSRTTPEVVLLDGISQEIGFGNSITTKLNSDRLTPESINKIHAAVESHRPIAHAPTRRAQSRPRTHHPAPPPNPIAVAAAVRATVTAELEKLIPEALRDKIDLDDMIEREIARQLAALVAKNQDAS